MSGGVRWSRVSLSGFPLSARSGHSCTIVSSAEKMAIMVFGGYGDSVEYDDFNLIEMDPDRGFVNTQVAPVDRSTETTARVGHASVFVNSSNVLYSFGGWNGKKYVNHGILYDLDHATILLEKNKGRLMPEGRRDHTLTFMPFTKKMYLFGGWNCVNDNLNELWCMDEHWDWSYVSLSSNVIPCSRRGHSACIFGNQMFVFGGLYGLSKYLNDLYVFDAASRAWYLAPCDGEAPAPRAWHSAVAIGHYMLVFGGTSGRTMFYDDLFVLHVDTMTWTKLDAIFSTSSNSLADAIETNINSPSFRACHSAVAIDNRVYIFGGISPVGKDYKITPQSDLWLLETNLPVNVEE